MPTYQDYIAQGMSPNQAALQAQMTPTMPQRQAPARGPSAPTPWKPTNTGSGLVGAPTQGGLPQAGPGQVMHGNQPGERGAQIATGGGNSGGYNADAKRQMDEIFGRYGRTPTAAEYDQWLGPSGYIMKDDVDGTGRKMAAYTGGDIDPYWAMRMGYHARDEDYGGGIDQMRARQQAGLQNYGFNTAQAMQSNGINSVLQGDALGRIQQAIQAINGQGQVNLDALLRSLQGV